MREKNNVNNTIIRNSSVELFRIILMLLIIAHHYVVNSGLYEVIIDETMNKHSFFYLIFGAWGKTAINCFVLITGYYMYERDIKIKKWLGLIFEVLFYNLIIYIFFICINYITFSWKGMIGYVFSFRTYSTGFIECFIIFYLLIPFLNILIRGIEYSMHFKLVGILLFLYTIVYTFELIDWHVSYNYVSWFVVLYLIGALYKKYKNHFIFITNHRVFFLMCSLILAIASIMMVYVYDCVNNASFYVYYGVADSNRFLALTVGVFMFLCFVNMHVEYSKFINIIAGSTFGILCIHANSSTMREWLWIKVLNNKSYFYEPILKSIIHAFGSVLLVYLVCLIIDLLRRALFFLINKYLCLKPLERHNLKL